MSRRLGIPERRSESRSLRPGWLGLAVLHLRLQEPQNTRDHGVVAYQHVDLDHLLAVVRLGEGIPGVLLEVALQDQLVGGPPKQGGGV
jgi:hypothetical protein